MSYARIWVHAVWATHRRQKLLSQGLRQKVFQHIFQQGLKKSIKMIVVNGYDDHVHCLFQLNPAQALGDSIRYLKGESSFWINRQRLTPTRFKWQDGYYAESVSEDQFDSVRSYILNQEEHHYSITFRQEFEAVFERLFA